MAELAEGYAKRLWEAWKDYEKVHGALSGVQLAKRVEARIGRAFDNTKLSKIHRGKRRATVDEHYALADELEINPDRLAGVGQYATQQPRPISGEKGREGPAISKKPRQKKA